MTSAWQITASVVPVSVEYGWRLLENMTYLISIISVGVQWFRGFLVWDLCPGVWNMLYCVLQYLQSNYLKKSHLHQVILNNQRFWCFMK